MAETTENKADDESADDGATSGDPGLLGLLSGLALTPPPAQLPGIAGSPGGQGAPALPKGAAEPEAGIAATAQAPGQITGQATGQAIGQAAGQATGQAAGQASAAPAGGTPGEPAGKAGDPVSAGPRRAGGSGDPVAPGDAKPEPEPSKIDFAAALAGTAQPQPPADPRGAKEAAAAAAPAHAAAAGERASVQGASTPIQIGQVPLTIGLRSLAGSSHFEIRLDPGDLGRIDVKLDIDKERGTVMTHLVIERIETLQMLQRDANSLQQALSQAGLDPSEGGINLSLRGDNNSSGGNAEQREDQSRGSLPRFGDVEARSAVEAVPLRSLRGLTGLDIRI